MTGDNSVRTASRPIFATHRPAPPGTGSVHILTQLRLRPKPNEFIGFGDIHGPKPYEFIGFKAKMKIANKLFLRIRAGIGPKPLISLRKWQCGGPPGEGRQERNNALFLNTTGLTIALFGNQHVRFYFRFWVTLRPNLTPRPVPTGPA